MVYQPFLERKQLKPCGFPLTCEVDFSWIFKQNGTKRQGQRACSNFEAEISLWMVKFNMYLYAQIPIFGWWLHL